jgi:hypothetical protein
VPNGAAQDQSRAWFASGSVVVIRHLIGSVRPDGSVNVRVVSYRVCWRPTGRMALIFRSRPLNGRVPLIGVRARGGWLVYSTVGGGPVTSRTGIIQSIDVRNGRFGPVVRETAGVVAGGDGAIPDLTSYVGQFAITANGYFAWVLAVRATPRTPAFSGLVAPLWDGRDYFVDGATAITGLSAMGTTLRWRADGQLKTVVLPDPVQGQQVE